MHVFVKFELWENHDSLSDGAGGINAAEVWAHDFCGEVRDHFHGLGTAIGRKDLIGSLCHGSRCDADFVAAVVTRTVGPQESINILTWALAFAQQDGYEEDKDFTPRDAKTVRGDG